MINKLFSIAVFILFPASVIGALLQFPETVMFIMYSVTIIALAGIIGRATENLTIVLGNRLGGLLNATFGNAVELIISFFALKAGLLTIVLASLTGSVLGNLLLVAGLSFFVGGLKYKRQTFNIHDARTNSALLIFSVIVAFVIPVVFSQTMTHETTMMLSVGIAIILIIIYLAGLFFKLVTHRGIYQSGQQIEEVNEGKPEWGKGRAMFILALATIAVAYISDKLVLTFDAVATSFGWSELFIGVIIVAIVGNAAEHASAILMAYKNKMDAAIEIAVGSSLQIAMFVLPVLVLLSLAFSTKMELIFTWPELISMITAVLIAVIISNDGETNWFEGLILLAAYVIMAIGFYFV